MEVYTYIIKFTLRNPAAEAKIFPHTQQQNGRPDFIALRNHYKGIGVHSINVVQADKVIYDLFYVGEKNPHTWWDEFVR